MLSSVSGSVDGIQVAIYHADQEYDLTATAGAQDLAAAFVAAGLAEECGAQQASAVEVTQADGDSSAPVQTKPGRKPKAQ